MLNILSQIPILNKLISSLGVRLLKLLNKNRGYYKINGINMFLDFLDPIDREIIITKKYEIKEISTLNKLIDANKTNYFIDVGANCGFYSLNISLQYKDLNILAFEPNIDAYQKFNKTLEGNIDKFQNIKIYNYGLSDKKSKLKMRSKIKHGYTQTGGSTIHDGETYNDVSIYDADFELGDEKLKFVNSNLAIKIDVEGHEFSVLLGLKKLLTNNKCIIQIEIFNDNFEKSNNFLLNNNFKKISEINSNIDSIYKNYFYSNVGN